MKRMTNDAPAEEKLKAVKSAVAGFMSMQEHLNLDIPTEFLRIFQNIVDDDYTDFMMFEPQDEEKRKQLLDGLNRLLDAVKES